MAALTRLAARRPRPRSAVPPSNRAARSPERSALATPSIVSAGTQGAPPCGCGAHGPTALSDHEESAGSTRVATHPGGPYAAASASAASAPTSSARAVTRYHPETGRANEAMSDWSGASKRAW